MTRRTPAWRWSRLELGVGVALTAIAALLVWVAPPYWIYDVSALLALAPYAIAAAGCIVGLVWMIRIMRGPRDEPPPWRYRDL